MSRISHIEIAGRDGEGLRDFYSRLFGWDFRRRKVAGFDYYEMDNAGQPSAGIRHEPDGKAEIVLYVEVDDVEVAVGRAVELGASVRIPPMTYEGLKFALLNDPEGNPIGVTQA